MKKTSSKKLRLNRETVRDLQVAELGRAVGGFASIPCASRGCSVVSCGCPPLGTANCPM